MRPWEIKELESDNPRLKKEELLEESDADNIEFFNGVRHLTVLEHPSTESPLLKQMEKG